MTRPAGWDFDRWDYIAWGVALAVGMVLAYARDWQARKWDGWDEEGLSMLIFALLGVFYVARRLR